MFLRQHVFNQKLDPQLQICRKKKHYYFARIALTRTHNYLSIVHLDSNTLQRSSITSVRVHRHQDYITFWNIKKKKKMPVRVSSNGRPFGVIPRGRLFKSPKLPNAWFLWAGSCIRGFTQQGYPITMGLLGMHQKMILNIKLHTTIC